MSDTSPEIERRMTEMLATKTPAERLSMMFSMFESAKKLIIAGLQHDGITDKRELKKQLFLRLYGDCFSDEEKEKILRHILKAS